jgi:hypothetical protein
MGEKSRGKSQVAIANAALIGHRIGRAGHNRQAWITHPLSRLNQPQLGYLLQVGATGIEEVHRRRKIRRLFRAN